MSDRTSPPEARLMRLGRGLRTALEDEPTELEAREAFERFHTTLGRNRSPLRSAHGFVAAAAAIALVGVSGYFAWPDPSITFETTALTDPSSGYIRVGEDQSAASVAFSDGSHLMVQPESRARIAEVTADGARVALEGGSLHLNVKPRPDAKWSVEAGPYRIHVTGTEFDVDWRAHEDVLEVVMQEGSVRVEGPMTSQGIQVAAGERLVANLKSSELRLGTAEVGGGDEEASEPTPVAASTSEPKVQPETSPVRPKSANGAKPPAGKSPTSSGSSPHKPADWKLLMKQAAYQQIVADAQQRGLDAVLSTAALPDLAILADAARYSGQSGVASRALVAERQRFAGSRQSRSAAFMLGRIAEDHLGDIKTALSWYTTYLQESPSGAFASESLGRKMGLVRRSRGQGAAESLARSYLRRFPKGPYATAAQKILIQ